MRKLATAAFCFSVGIVTAHYILPGNMLIPCGVILLAASFIGLAFSGNTKLRIIIIPISFAFGLLWSFTYTYLFISAHHDITDETVTLHAAVKDYPVARQPRGYYVDVELSHINRKVGARLYFYDETELKPGDEIKINVKLRRADISYEGERYDTLSSKGIFLTGSISGKIEIIGTNNSLKYQPRRITKNITEKIDEIFGSATAPFLKALLTGKREDLNNDVATTASLTGSGIIHIVAVSGMHISFLMGTLGQVIKNRRLFAFYGIPVLLLFMAMTGFTPAVVRAGTMQIFLICAPLFKRESDGITSLSAAMLLMMILNPYACASVGLQLSFAATLGIIKFTPKISLAMTDFTRHKKIPKNKLIHTAINYVCSSLSASIGALIFTLPLLTLHFGYFSLISPITNILTIGVVSVTFPLGFIVTIIGFIYHDLSMVLAKIVEPLVKYILFIARTMGSVPYSVIYSSDAHIMFWLAYVYVLFVIMAFFKARARQYIYPVCIAIIMLFSVILVSQILTGNDTSESITAVDIGQGSCTVINRDSSTIVIDCGSLSKYNAGEIAHEFLQSNGHTTIDILGITHFHEDHISGIEFLLSRTKVSALIIPDPEGSYLATDIIELARRNQTDIIYAAKALTIEIGESRLFVYPSAGGGDDNERGLTFLYAGRASTLITGDMNSSMERALLRQVNLPKLDILIVGHHGSRESTSHELLSALTPKIAVISSGKNSFGHPHKETLERLYNYGVTVYRTDEIGHVTIGN